MWLKLQDAARELNVTVSALNKAIQRGTSRYVWREVFGRGGKRGITYEIQINEETNNDPMRQTTNRRRSEIADEQSRHSDNGDQERAHTARRCNASSQELPNSRGSSSRNTNPAQKGGRAGSGYAAQGLSEPEITEKITALEVPNGKLTAQDKARIVEIACNYRDRDALNSLFRDRGIALSAKTLYRWRKNFETKGAKALSDTRGGNHSKIDREALKMALMSKGNFHLTSVYEAYKILVPQYSNSETALNITLSAFYKAAKKLIKTDKHIKYAIRGKDVFLNQAPVTMLKTQKEFVRNEEWQIDASPCDVIVIGKKARWDDKTKAVIYESEPMRVKILSIIDRATTRRVMGLFSEDDSYSNVRILKRALLAFGKPKTIKLDNGAAYISEHFRGVLARLGIAAIYSRPFHGEDKPQVERGFKTFQHDRDIELMPGAIGHNVSERDTIEKMKATKAEWIQKGKTNIKNIMSWEQFQGVMDGWTEKAEAECGWLALWNEYPEEPAKPKEYEIDRAIGKSKFVKYSRTGVRYQGNDFRNLDLEADGIINSRVEIVEDIDDISVLHIYSEEGEYLGAAKNSYLKSITVEEARRVKKAATAKLRKHLSEANKANDFVEAGVLAKYNEAYQRETERREAEGLRKDIKNLTDPANNAAPVTYGDVANFILNKHTKQIGGIK
jgi:transposase